MRRADALDAGFALGQLLLVPFLRDRPVLLVAVGGHVVAVTLVSGVALALWARSKRRKRRQSRGVSRASAARTA